MNGDDTDSGISHSEAWPIALEGSSPDWLETGGISGESQVVEAPFQEDDQSWNTDADTEIHIDEDYIPGGSDCVPPGGDTSKIYFKATHYVDGKWTCYWIDSTTCP